MELSAVGELISWSQQNLPRTPVNFPRPLVDPTASPQSQMNSTFLPGANCYASSVPSSSAESYWSSGANESAVDSKESPQQNFLPPHMRLEPINGSHDATAYGGPPNWSNDTERPGESQNQPPPGHGVKTETPGSLGFSQRPEGDQNGSGVTPFFDVGDFRGPNFFGTPGNPNQSEGQPMYGEYSPLSVPQGQVSFHSVPAPEILALTPPGCEREIQSRSRDELVGFEGSRSRDGVNSGGGTPGGGASGGGGAGGRGRGRAAGGSKFTVDQLQRLENIFDEQSYPSTSMKTKLCDELGMTLPQMHRWFEQRRKKERNKGKVLVAPGREGHERSSSDQQLSPGAAPPVKSKKSKSNVSNTTETSQVPKSEWQSTQGTPAPVSTANNSLSTDDGQNFVDCITVPNCLPASTAIYGSPQCVPVSTAANYFCDQQQQQQQQMEPMRKPYPFVHGYVGGVETPGFGGGVGPSGAESRCLTQPSHPTMSNGPPVYANPAGNYSGAGDYATASNYPGGFKTLPIPGGPPFASHPNAVGGPFRFPGNQPPPGAPNFGPRMGDPNDGMNPQMAMMGYQQFPQYRPPPGGFPGRPMGPESLQPQSHPQQFALGPGYGDCANTGPPSADFLHKNDSANGMPNNGGGVGRIGVPGDQQFYPTNATPYGGQQPPHRMDPLEHSKPVGYANEPSFYAPTVAAPPTKKSKKESKAEQSNKGSNKQSPAGPVYPPPHSFDEGFATPSHQVDMSGLRESPHFANGRKGDNRAAKYNPYAHPVANLSHPQATSMQTSLDPTSSQSDSNVSSSSSYFESSDDRPIYLEL